MKERASGWAVGMFIRHILAVGSSGKLAGFVLRLCYRKQFTTEDTEEDRVTSRYNSSQS